MQFLINEKKLLVLLVKKRGYYYHHVCGELKTTDKTEIVKHRATIDDLEEAFKPYDSRG